MAQSCCENANYFFSKTKPDDSVDLYSVVSEEFEHKDYYFDTAFFEELSHKQLDYGGGMVAFRLLNKDGGEMYLMLYNCHNGYYGHGFQFKIGEEAKKEGTL